MQVLDKPQTSNTQLHFTLTRPTYKEARAIVKGRVFNLKSYALFRQNNPQFNLPSVPAEFYKGSGWVSAYEFLGTTRVNPSKFAKQYWADVHAGKRTHAPKYKAKAKVTFPIPDKAKSNVVETKSTTTFQDKQAFIALAKKLGVYDKFRPAFKTLFTYEELLDMINL